MRCFSRVALILSLAVLGTGVMTSTSGGAPSTAYPPITRSVPGVPLACTSPASTIPPVPAGKVAPEEKEITAFVGHHLSGLGQCGHGLLVLTLTPGSESLAQKVRARFGPSVQIMVGLTQWDGRPGQAPTCGSLGQPSPSPAGYSATLDLRSKRIGLDADLAGHVTLRNTGSSNVRVLTGNPIEVVLTRPGTRRVVGIYGGAVAGTAYGPLLAPGRSTTVGIVGGTARCDGGTGSALPPGHYDAVAEVSGVGVDGSGGGANGQPPPTYFTPFVPIQIVH
jgi:hypothetical protein